MSYIENTQLKYADLFAKHGATLDGLAWPSGEGSHNFRTNKLLEVIDKKLNNQEKISILDLEIF